MTNHQLTNFTEETLRTTQSAWEALMDEDAFQVEFDPVFEWARAHLVYVDGDSAAFGMFNTDTGKADAIVEIVKSKKGTMAKMLRVILSPRFWDINNQRSELIELYVSTIIQVITSNGFKSLHKVKMYGRDDEMMSVLRSIHSKWDYDRSRAEFEGRFLTISWD